jgi:ADP-ribose pyrophosphatase
VDTVRFPDGSTGELELVRHSGASAVVAILGDPEDPDPRIVLLRQFRYAAGGELFEVPAGRPDRPGEPWEEVAARELEEETGYVHGRLDRLTTIYTTPASPTSASTSSSPPAWSQGTTNLDHDEFVEVVVMPLSRVLAAIRDGRIIDAKSISPPLLLHLPALISVTGSRRGGADRVGPSATPRTALALSTSWVDICPPDWTIGRGGP